jgi:hypothetical protein
LEQEKLLLEGLPPPIMEEQTFKALPDQFNCELLMFPGWKGRHSLVADIEALTALGPV